MKWAKDAFDIEKAECTSYLKKLCALKGTICSIEKR
jgi:hypothetical protein